MQENQKLRGKWQFCTVLRSKRNYNENCDNNFEIINNNMVMVNLMCNLTELKDAQIAGTTWFLGMSVSVFRKDLHSFSELSSVLPSLICVGIIQSVKGLNRTKRQRKGEFPLQLECPSFPALEHWSSCFSGFQTQGPTPAAPLALPPPHFHSQSFGFGLS